MRSCNACGEAVSETAAFCPACGHRLRQLRPSDAAPMRSERKIVTVLFADIKDSIALVTQYDPETAGDVLAETVDLMSGAVRRFGGTVNQIMGDGIMALFGAPLAIEDHAAKAAMAALAMRDAVVREVRLAVGIRVGLASGEVVVRAQQGDVALHYSAAGEAVHMASRMEHAAAPGQVLLTGTTLALAGGLLDVRNLGGTVVKGVAEPMPAFELLRVLPGRAPARAPDRPAFVGRVDELALLRRARDEASSGHGVGVRVVGDAGCGKSRLVREFTLGHLPEDWTVCRAEAVSHRRSSYSVITDLLNNLFGLNQDDPADRRRDKVCAGMALAPSAADDELAPLAPLLGLPAGPAPGWAGLEPQERRERTMAAAANAIHRTSLRRPVAVLVEDAHWLDPESAGGIARLAAQSDGPRLLTIVTERPGGTLLKGSGLQSCCLPTLDERGTRALLDDMLLPGPDVLALERKLIEHTRGNPLFIEECLQALVDTDQLVRVGERFRLDRPVDVLRVPNSLRGLLDERVDRLTDLDKDVLQAASVVGNAVALDVLQPVAGVDPVLLRPVLARLCEAGFLVPDDGAGERFAFKHGLIREAAYNGILLRNRLRMHGAVLDTLEQQPAAIEAVPDLLAAHAMQAESWPKAVAYSRIAAARAYDRYANPEASHHYRQALAAAERLPEGPDRSSTLLELHIAIRWPLFRLGHVAALRPHMNQAIRLASDQDDHTRLGQSHVLHSHVQWLTGAPAQAAAAAATAARMAAEREDRNLAVRAEFQHGLIHLARNDIPGTIATMRQVIEHLGPNPPATGPYGLDADLAVTALGYMARAHAAAGSFPEAAEAVAQATRLAAQLAKRQTWIYVHMARGVLLLAQGRPDQAVEVLERGQQTCRAADIRLLAPVVEGYLALACLEAGQLERGTVLARQAVDDAERMEFRVLQPLRLAILGQAHLLSADLTSGFAAVSMALDLAEQQDEPGAGAFALALLAELQLRDGHAAASARSFAQALSQAETLGLRPLAASIRQRIEQPDNRAHPWLDGVTLSP